MRSHCRFRHRGTGHASESGAIADERQHKRSNATEPWPGGSAGSSSSLGRTQYNVSLKNSSPDSKADLGQKSTIGVDILKKKVFPIYFSFVPVKIGGQQEKAKKEDLSKMAAQTRRLIFRKSWYQVFRI